MSAVISRYIREVLDEREDLSPTARHLLEVLGHVANSDGMSWWSVGQLARRMGLADRMTVKRARRQLVNAGLIVFTESRGRGRTNLYALPITEQVRSLSGDENGALTRENGALTRGKGSADAPRSIQEGSIEGPSGLPTGSCARCGAGFDLDHDTGDLCGRCWFIETRATRRLVTG